ncbi:S-methyl-5-thioribose-1-phosphate isomerase [bacterium]|nr:S-methyl-5-thioribose-1-phosphate isomerase [bacterium]
MWPSMEWKKDRLVLIDQRKLPLEEVYVECTHFQEVAEAIEKMVVRGAPAIGVAAGFGVVLGVKAVQTKKKLDERFPQIVNRLKDTRPTARNLFWALERMEKAYRNHSHLQLTQLKEKIEAEALAGEREDVETNKKIGERGQELIGNEESILTYCNAGALATAGYGTALGVIRAAFEKGKRIRVYASETRPFLQGARLTCWELDKEEIPVTLITDNMAGYLMKKGMISVVITGADRIAPNGDTANKIGTYTLAVLAKEHHIPFCVAAPTSTIDWNLKDGDEMMVEERPPDEVRKMGAHSITFPHLDVRNPAFDITPFQYISALITEKGAVKPPYKENLRGLEKR